MGERAEGEENKRRKSRPRCSWPFQILCVSVAGVVQVPGIANVVAEKQWPYIIEVREWLLVIIWYSSIEYEPLKNFLRHSGLTLYSVVPNPAVPGIYEGGDWVAVPEQ